jgi:ribosomal protein S24E
MEILQNVENKLLGRREILAIMSNEKGTPKRVDIRKELAKALKVKEDLIMVNKVTHQYGSSNIEIKAKAYENEKSLKINARPHMIKRNSAAEHAEEGKEE